MLKKEDILEAVINGKLNGAITVMDILGDDISPLLKVQLEFFIDELKDIIKTVKEIEITQQN